MSFFWSSTSRSSRAWTKCALSCSAMALCDFSSERNCSASSAAFTRPFEAATSSSALARTPRHCRNSSPVRRNLASRSSKAMANSALMCSSASRWLCAGARCPLGACGGPDSSTDSRGCQLALLLMRLSSTGHTLEPAPLSSDFGDVKRRRVALPTTEEREVSSAERLGSRTRFSRQAVRSCSANMLIESSCICSRISARPSIERSCASVS
mmetsp:Transcript_51996/g.149893  ORF Transcript_51996/g.149893 Transcript_51996/m.149893 type:complete len:211 (-) Transcript_51996:1106-1738(-)